jgi:type IV secretory pathway TrbL component
VNTTDASDYSPLAFGTGLAIGLMLIFALPRDTAAERRASQAAAGADPRQTPTTVDTAWQAEGFALSDTGRARITSR